jgi:succinate-acetate transporter protein
LKATYRASRGRFWWSLVGTAFYAAILVAWVTLLESPPETRWLAIGLGVVIWGGMTCLGLWLTVFHLRHRLNIDGDRVHQVGALMERECRLPDVIDARWRITPAGGGLRLKTRNRTLSIDLPNHERSAREELVRHFHAALPGAVQRDWAGFCYECLSWSRPALPEERVLVLTRRRWDWLFLASLPPFVVGGLYGWRVTGESRFLISPLALLPLWLLTRFSTSRQGDVLRLPPTSWAKHCWLGLSMFCMVALLMLLPLAGLVARSSLVLAMAMIAFAGCSLVIGYRWCFSRFERERQRLEAPLAQAAAVEWEATEAKAGREWAIGGEGEK